MKKIIVSIVLLLVSILLISSFELEKEPSVQGEIAKKEVISTVFKTISSSDFANKIETDNVSIIDIRTPEEFDSGHLKNAINIDFYSQDFKTKLSELDEQGTYLVYCRSGNRSSKALPIMQDLGFTAVYELEGGITAWTRFGQTLCKNC